MDIRNKTVLITGANRGIGRALVQEALKRGAKKVYAATRGASDFEDARDPAAARRDQRLTDSRGRRKG